MVPGEMKLNRICVTGPIRDKQCSCACQDRTTPSGELNHKSTGRYGTLCLIILI